jgi:hypothetical protein
MGEELKDFSDLFVQLGVLDSSHLAILPSSYLLDTAAWVAMPEKGNKISTKVRVLELSREDIFRKFRSPTGSIQISRKEARDASNKSRRVEEALKRWEGKTPRFIRTKGDTKDGDEQTFTFCITNRLMELISMLKTSIAKEHQEMATHSMFDLLVSRGSNPGTLEAPSPRDRIGTEKPEFRLVRDELSKLSLFRQAGADLPDEREPISTTVLRNLLLGKSLEEIETDGLETEIRKVALKQYSDKKCDNLFARVIKNNELRFGKNDFTPARLVETLRKRMVCLGECGELLDELRPWIKEDFESKELQSHIVLMKVADEIKRFWRKEGDEDGESDQEELGAKNFREVMNNISGAISSTDLEQMIEDAHEENEGVIFDEAEVWRDLHSAKVLLNQIHNMYFQCERQEAYLANKKENEGKGVYFPFDGLTDAVRSVPEEYLAILNHSIDVPTSLIADAVDLYFVDFLEQPSYKEELRSTGAFFSQRLADGPLSHLTLVQPSSGPVEIAKSFNDVIRQIKGGKMDKIVKTRIHAYSFLKNILWLSTFKRQWLKGKILPSYDSSFDIPLQVIKNIYSKPMKIRRAINNTIAFGDSNKASMPAIDTEAWRNLRNLKGENNEEILARSQYLLTDLLMINALKYKAMAECSKEEDARNKFDELLVGYGQNEDDIFMTGISEIYPETLWKKRFERRAFSSENVSFSRTDISDDEEEDDWGWGDDSPSDAEEGGFEDMANGWENALKTWMKRIRNDDIFMVEDSGHEDIIEKDED